MVLTDPDQLDLCARSCHYCRDACTAAIARSNQLRNIRSFPELAKALSSCRELLRLTEDSVRSHSPAHLLMCNACAAACTLCGRACDAMNVLLGAAGRPDAVIKEVGDTCWITSQVCSELVGGHEED